MTAELRAWVEIHSMHSQWAAYVAQTCQGDPPHAGMAQLYVEVAPASRVFALVNAALEHARVRSALQIVERQYGTLELHGADPSVVRQAGSAVLELLGASATDRELPQVVSHEIVTRVDPNQAQLVNRMRVANLLLEDETMFLMEVAPAAYARRGGERGREAGSGEARSFSPCSGRRGGSSSPAPLAGGWWNRARPPGGAGCCGSLNRVKHW